MAYKTKTTVPNSNHDWKANKEGQFKNDILDKKRPLRGLHRGGNFDSRCNDKL